MEGQILKMLLQQEEFKLHKINAQQSSRYLETDQESSQME